MKLTKTKLIIICTLVFIFLILSIFRINSELSDFFVTNVSSVIVNLIGSLTNSLPFSLFEIVLILLVIIALIILFLLIKNIFKLKFKKVFSHLLNLLIFALVVSNSFITICGVAYQRSEVDLPFYEKEITTELVDNTIAYYLNDYNDIVTKFEKDKNDISKCPYTFDELASIMIVECERLNESDYYYKFTARPKNTWFSPILNELHITGVDFPFTCEANINGQLPSIDIPFTMAHEIAHLKGVMREDDANSVALYICITSEDPYVRYSGYFRGFSRLLEIKAYTNHKEYKDIVSLMNPQIIKDSNDYYTFFEEHNLLEDISDFVNGIYLSINGEKDGTDSYIDESITESTGKTDEEGNEIRVYTSYSNYQKIMIQNYVEKNS